ncbi:MAG: uroporphyrinogen decarboxylase [Verrucomicrobia bacterium]|nr:uroporphyrinogen decarboxylase [Verrucomicrobiota bacterium]MCH8525844.1 uroporphyrinogen decarboxylase [Kiritimatiellia bacterium]
MTGKDILLKTLRCEAADRLPWVPFTGVHAGSLIGVNAEAYLKSADHIVAGLEAANARYQPDGVPVVFDLQLEAEVLGCTLAWAKETPPSVATHPLDGSYDLNSLPSFSMKNGRFPAVFDAIKRLKSSIGGDTALFGLLTGPLTLALHLRGEEFLLDMFDEEDGVATLMDFCTDIAIDFARAYLEAGIDVVAVVDPMISQIGPDHFEAVVAPSLNRIFDTVRDAGGLSSLFVCGNATRNLEVMSATTCDNICVDENVDLKKLGDVCRAAGKSFGGNLRLTTVFLLGDADATRRDVARCLREAGDGPGFMLAPGCDLPYACKPENIDVVSGIVHDDYLRQIALALPDVIDTDTFDDIVIPDYAASAKVIVDVVTLDSAGCAPCTYMLKAAQEGARAAGIPVSVREHKITGRDGLGYMKKLKVTAIPSICINGEEKFASIIPERAELVAAIRGT